MKKIFILALKGLKRDWRAGELRLIGVSVVLAVASLTTVNFFTDRVQQATERQATELLAADLVVLSSAPIPDILTELADRSNLVSTSTTSFRSMVVANDTLQMAEVKAIRKLYPIRGRLRVTETLFGLEQDTDSGPAPGFVWPDARLLQILGISTGDTISLGDAEFIVDKILSYEPDRGGDIFNIAPRLLMNESDVESTGLILPGSRVQYRLLLGGESNQITRFRESIESYENLRVQGIRDARPELKSALERAEQFLGLAALVSIALAGLAVAMSAQQYATRHFDSCAIMRCLGATQSTISQLFITQMFLLACLSSVLGIIAGYMAQYGLASLLRGLTANELPEPSLLPVIFGFCAGIITSLGFALPQLLRLKNISPLRVLRRDMSPLPVSGLISYGVAIVSLALLTPWQSGNPALTLYTFAGLLLTAAVLMLSAKLIIRLINRYRSKVGTAWRYGFANVARRSSLSVAQILGIGLGVMIMLLLTLIRTDLLESWRNRLPEGTPNYFLINIQADKVGELKSFLSEKSTVTSELYPMIRGRLVARNKENVSADDYSDARAKRLVTREFNLSFAATMQEDNLLHEGEWWEESASEPLLSVEEGIAETLGIKLGDELTYNIGGQEVSGHVSNLRKVEWDSFNVNFFVIANPGTLEQFPATYITSFHLPTDQKHILNQLAAEFTSVTIFDIDALLTQVRVIMDQVANTVEFVFGFTLIAGLIVMLSALQTTHSERSHESALLRSLGAGRGQILAGLSAEFIILGLIAGVLAAFSATAVELVLAEFVLKIEVAINPWVWLIAPLVCTLVILSAGVIATYSVIRTPPIVSLRKT